VKAPGPSKPSALALGESEDATSQAARQGAGQVKANAAADEKKIKRLISQLNPKFALDLRLLL
jgi:hypothetical protein